MTAQDAQLSPDEADQLARAVVAVSKIAKPVGSAAPRGA